MKRLLLVMYQICTPLHEFNLKKILKTFNHPWHVFPERPFTHEFIYMMRGVSPAFVTDGANAYNLSSYMSILSGQLLIHIHYIQSIIIIAYSRKTSVM